MENNSRIAALNEKYAIDGVARFSPGSGGLPHLAIETGLATAQIYLQGAQVTSWRPSGMVEALFVSKKSSWENGKAIRGGIPVCFPWFRAKADNPHAPSHGFVRTKEWRVESLSVVPGDAVCACFSTESDEASRKWWPFEFRLDYRITVGRELKLELEMTNAGRNALRFEEALHTYFNVGDVKHVQVRGLGGVNYLDNRDGNREKTQMHDLVLAGQTDNAYISAMGPVEIVDPVLRRSLTTRKQNSCSTIVWNPWSEGAATMRDLGGDEWRRMLCVEGANILGSAASLDGGQKHTMTVTIDVAQAAG